MRLVGMIKQDRRNRQAVPAVVAQRIVVPNQRVVREPETET